VSRPVIEARGVSRWYGHVVGVLEVSFEVGPGVTALLGPNGSGKTTMLRMLTGRLRPDRGEVGILGADPWAEREVLRRVGYAPEMAPLYPAVSARVFLQDLLWVHGFPRREAGERARAALERFGLSEASERKAGGFSKGMRQRLRLAQAFAHEPDLLLLDEPLAGLDPMGRGQVMDRIREFGEAGKTVLVCSHILHEVEEMTDRVLILHHGRLLADGTIYEIRELLDSHPLQVTVTCDEPRRVLRLLVEREDVTGARVEEDGRSLTVETRRPDLFHRRLVKDVEEAGVVLHGVRSADENLESIFEYLVKGT